MFIAKAMLFLLPLFGALVIAQSCRDQCPQIKCPGNDPVALCNCINFREQKCKEACSDYVPLLRPCPTGPSTSTHLLLLPTTTSTAPPTVATCTCEPEFCTLDYPQGCYCQNDVKKRCYERCGGPEPAYLSCPALPTSTFQTSTRRPPHTTTSTRLPKPTPVPTNDICGGGRANYLLCDKGYICINNPFVSGCGLECDATGICVSERGCGGFAGTPCPDSRQICVDDPRDDCVAEEGGRDCMGLCMFK